jgi:fructoselysine-6-P-deglycase FrlB-like protein
LSTARLERQRDFNMRMNQSLSAVYFGSSPLAGAADRFAMLHMEGKDV